MTEKYSTNSDDAPRLPLGKPCNKCGEWRLFEEFTANRNCKNGRESTCKVCAYARIRRWQENNSERVAASKRLWSENNPDYDREYYEANRERFLERARKQRREKPEELAEYWRRYRENNKEEIAEYKRRWYEENAEQRAEYRRQWYEANKERHQENARRFLSEHPERKAEYQNRRRARKRAADGDYTAQEFLELCAACGGMCLCCGATERLTADHVVPLSKGGSNGIENIQVLCMSCNARKGTKTIDYR